MTVYIAFITRMNTIYIVYETGQPEGFLVWNKAYQTFEAAADAVAMRLEKENEAYKASTFFQREPQLPGVLDTDYKLENIEFGILVGNLYDYDIQFFIKSLHF